MRMKLINPGLLEFISRNGIHNMNWIQNQINKLSTLEWCLFFYLWIAFAFFFNEYPGWNVNSRMDLVYSIVDAGSLNINQYIVQPEYKTDDAAIYNGYYYCDKSPILSFTGVPFYWVYAHSCDLLGMKVNLQLGRLVTTIFTVSLFSAILAVLLFRFLGQLKKNSKDQLLTTLFFALGTLAFPYSILFFSHQFTAFLGFLGFILAYRIIHKWETWKESTRRWQLCLCGFVTALAVVNEQPAGIILLGVTFYLYFGLPDRKQIFWMFPGALLAMMIPLPYNAACFDDPFSSGYQYEITPVFKEGMAQGLMGVTLPTFNAFMGITFSHFRGIFFHSPWLLLVFPGLLSFWKMKEFRKEWLLCVYIIIGFLGFNSSYYTWWGGWGIGPRHLIPMLPFMVIVIYSYLPKLKPYFIALGLYSILIMVLVCVTEPQVPDSFMYPLAQFTIFRLVDGIFTRNVFSIIGVPRFIAVIIWVIYLIGGGVFLSSLSRKEQSTNGN